MSRFICVFVLLLVSVGVYAQQVDKITVYTTWDEQMLYLAVSAQGPDLRAVHKDFNKPIEGDDGIEVFFNLSDDRSLAVYSDKTAYLAISAAGGFEFRRGDGTRLVKQNIFSHRYGVDVQGNLNDTNNIDSGFSIELAVPWSELGGKNISYKAIGIDFKVTVCGKAYYLTDSDSFMKPEKCWDLLLSNLSVMSTKGQHRIVANRYMSEPVINGEIKENEWFSRTAYVIEIPVEGLNPYKLVYTNQIVRPVVFSPEKGTKGGFDDPRRVSYLKQLIDGLTANGADVLAIPAENPYIVHIFEALRSQLSEGRAATPVSPVLSGCSDPRRALFEFYAGLPEQFRRTVVDAEGNTGYPVYTDTPDEALADEFLKTYRKKIIFRSMDELEKEKEARRPRKAYSYFIAGINIPERLNPTVARQVCVSVKNTGTLTWKPGDAGLYYRWYINGRFYSDCIVPIPIMAEVAPGGIYQLNAPIAPISGKHKPLPAGEAICEIDMITLADNKSMSKPDEDTFLFNTLIEEPAIYVEADTKEARKAREAAKKQAPAPYVVAADEPVIIAPDGTYRIILNVMNTSCEEWAADKTFVEAQLCVRKPDGTEDKGFKGSKFQLLMKSDVPDGMIAVFDGVLDTEHMRAIAEGAAERYFIKYCLVNKKERSELRSHPLLVSPEDLNQTIIALKALEKDEESGEYVLPVAVRNAGSKKWQSQNIMLAAKWYSPDGTPAGEYFYKELLQTGKKAKTIDPGAILQKNITFKDIPGQGKWYLVVELVDNGVPFNNEILEKANDKVILETEF